MYFRHAGDTDNALFYMLVMAHACRKHCRDVYISHAGLSILSHNSRYMRV